ncbi:hypothetical protein EBH45_13525 [Enterobacter hormaechei]|nr:hypothetical protein EBH45_13525 [Enterobacter hormaechei]
MCQRSVTSRMPQIASIKLPYLLYCYLLIIHLCGAKKNKIHRNPGQKNVREGANKQVISSQADSLIKISRIWADFFPANTSNQPI